MSALPPFERVIEAHGLDVWRFAVSQVGAGRADDVFQDTMLAALRAYPSLRGPALARSWLLRIAARKAIDAFRTAARAPTPVAEVEAGSSVDSEPPDEALWARVRALPARQRQAVGLRFVLDLAYAEIGEAMGTSPEAARRSVFEGLKTLRALLPADHQATAGRPQAASREPR